MGTEKDRKEAQLLERESKREVALEGDSVAGGRVAEAAAILEEGRRLLFEGLRVGGGGGGGGLCISGSGRVRRAIGVPGRLPLRGSAERLRKGRGGAGVLRW